MSKNEHHDEEQRLLELLSVTDVPDYMHEGLARYICRGIPPGNFLSALLSNDLAETYKRADIVNRKHVSDYVKFLYNHAPAGCWGSEEQYDDWCRHHGLFGLNLKPRKDDFDEDD